MKKGGCTGHMAAYWLVIIGALNWGLVGAFNFNLVNRVLGSVNMLERIVYVLVGLSAVLMLMHGKACKKCRA